jgi:hypothetical protein
MHHAYLCSVCSDIGLNSEKQWNFQLEWKKKGKHIHLPIHKHYSKYAQIMSGFFLLYFFGTILGLHFGEIIFYSF